MQFIWDSWNTNHIAKHGVSPREAEEVIENDPFDLDVQIVNGEERTLSIGGTNAGRVLLAVAAWIEDLQAVRIVTVFKPSAAQRKQYEAWKERNYGTVHQDTSIRKPRRRSGVVGRESDDG